ncbi:signal transduction histidine kinase [Kitasatospora sp. MAA4]|uniref:sensor histidine kinase n=1 Tax=Kitasatospora sp. MAA4 TaxID=3035093 RepID=UPI002476FCD8|nr:histidine kinase [Kitasatospora sp. MAA4]MDH6135573.1 signal transduction histidine kinase [Kitasatospora sp. MAA4]
MRTATSTPEGSAPTAAPPAARTATRAGPSTSGLATAYGLCGLTLFCALGWVALALTHLDDHAHNRDIAFDRTNILLGLGFALSGLFILAHHSGRSLGRTLLAAGFATCLSRFLLFTLAVTGAGRAGGALGGAVLVLSETLLLFVMYAVALWFPDGRLPRGWGPWYAGALLLWSAVQSYDGHATAPDWYGLPSPFVQGGWARAATGLSNALDSRILWIASGLLLFNLVVAAVRWRRSPTVRPHQGVVLLPYLAWLVLVLFGERLGLSIPVLDVLATLTAALWPLALCYAFARDRSWSLDRTTRRVLTSFLLTGALIFGYFLLALELPHLLPGASGADAQLMAGCALVVGILVRPSAGVINRAVERFFYGERAHPYKVVRALAEHLGRAVDPGDAPPLLCDTVVRTLGLPGARVVVHTRSGSRELALLGRAGPESEVFPLIYEGLEIGELYAPPRSGELALDRQDQVVLRFLADQAAPSIACLRLSEDLQASRRRLVLAREEERRRLRHDLHDGLGPTLSGLRLQVDATGSSLPAGSAARASLLAAAEGIGQAIDELRRITDGMAPAELVRVGLADALRQLAGRLDGGRLRVAVELAPDPLPPLPAAVEVAVYRIAGEALNNVLRHSGAGRARLVLRVGPEEVTVEARDDGAGFPDHRPSSGVGLLSMAERAEELGGRFSIANDARGTVVSAVFPRLTEPLTHRPPTTAPVPEGPRRNRTAGS